MVVADSAPLAPVAVRRVVGFTANLPLAMTHRRAVAMMVAATLMWSIAGVVTRHLEAARSFEVTFWRSAFSAGCLLVVLGLLRGPAAVWRTLRGGGRALWISGICWAVMFTAFMLALTLTTVANVLVTMAISPLLSALLARWTLDHRLQPRTWGAIVVAGVGIGWMYARQIQGGDAAHWLGTLVALVVPLAAAINWTLIQRNALSRGHADAPDMLPAVLIGALLSSAVTLPLSLPLSASPHDLALLGLLGVVQLAIPCLMVVQAARVLAAPEVALLDLLEVVFGVLWAWLGAGESPSIPVLGGGCLVLGALIANEMLALRATFRPSLAESR
jgi:drug/metabolite transporter (DMT)-like permease